MGAQLTEYKLHIPSRAENLELIRNFVSGVARKVGFNTEDINKIELALDEACTNVIEHAYRDSEGDIDIAIKVDYQKFTLVVTDKGRSFPFKELEMPDMKQYIAELRVGGLGIYLMKTLMDEVEYHSQPGVKNEVQMVKYLLQKDTKQGAAANPAEKK